MNSRPQPEFAEARRRLQRATKHREEMIAIHVASEKDYGLRLRLRQRLDGNAVEVVVTFTADPMLSTVFGEWLAAVRGILDHIFYQLAIHETGKNPPSRPGQRQFPVCRDNESFESLLTGHAKPLHGFSPAMIDAVRAMQPFKGKYGPDGDAILWFHDLARQDRHRVPWEMGCLVHSVVPEFRPEDVSRIVRHYYADTAIIPPVASAAREFVPLVFETHSAADAEYFASGQIGVTAESKLEVVDWYVRAHTEGISANIRNDSLGDRMMFIEYFLGRVIDEFEGMVAR
ncbi:hypothetical protein QNM97_13920 [Gordonia sp. L191]|uniref:hypothetical protein n=1 Tax=Gordonia sp. L191 TaxID=2982699 RepID=UPI0024BFA81B|nr:hypothetical protein [Gordonia sp. L191]WHU45149.1 hypothetical protein QNM97_13920 [Gordonia sp. L191]